MSTYDDVFYDYVNSGAVSSAQCILPLLLQHIEIRSVLDVGCGQGAWLSVFRALGVAEIAGLDGAHVDQSKLLIPGPSFSATDLCQGFSLGKRYDLVQCLEVAEHLPPTSSAGFIDALVLHGDLILFSAAAKGQGGNSHINEQDYEYWRAHFARHGYVAIDYVRPLVLNNPQVEPWYRYNMFLYASPKRLASLPAVITRYKVSDQERLRDVSPSLYKLRKMLVRMLPAAIGTRIAKIKEKLIARARAN